MKISARFDISFKKFTTQIFVKYKKKSFFIQQSLQGNLQCEMKTIQTNSPIEAILWKKSMQNQLN